MKLLAQAKEELHLDTANGSLDRSEVRAAIRVVPGALTLAAQIVATDPHQFAAFDAEAIGSAAEYVQVLLPVLRDAQRFVHALYASIMSKRLPASKQTLALHAMLKALGRIDANAALQSLADDLAAQIDRRGKKRVLSDKEKAARSFVKAQAKKIAKQKAKLIELEQKSFVPASAPQPAPAPAPAPTAEAPGGVTVTVSGNTNAH